MKKLLIAILLCGAIPLAQGEAPVDELRVTMRQELLRLINRDRKQFGLAPVELDTYASTVADGYCEEQIRNGTTGHFTLNGEAPYMRYSFAGGSDAVSENAAAWSASYRFGDNALVDMMRRSEQAMMAEVSPHDGHRRTILDPMATHVGLGFAWKDGEFRMTQEFIRRYVTWSRPLPRRATLGDRLPVVGTPAAGYLVDAISVHHEPLPQALTATEANHINSYSLPNDRRDYLPRLKMHVEQYADGRTRVTRQSYADGHSGDFPLADDGGFAFNLPLVDGPGIYTVVVWLRRPNEREAFSATTVSVKVDGDRTLASTAKAAR